MRFAAMIMTGVVGSTFGASAGSFAALGHMQPAMLAGGIALACVATVIVIGWRG